MKTRQSTWSPQSGWSHSSAQTLSTPPSLVLVFGGRAVLSGGEALGTLAELYPRSTFFGCSTAGEIADVRVHDDQAVATAIWLEKSSIRTAALALADTLDASDAGARLGRAIPHEGLVHALVLSDGTQVNGSALVAGLTSSLPPHVQISGGLSGDGTAFGSTVVCAAGVVGQGVICIIGFYGELTIGVGSLGGWDSFGADREVTSSSANVLRTLDGEPALELYKRYLGSHAAELPSSALLFPLLVRVHPDAEPVVRTVLKVDEVEGTMTFAGDVPQGARAQLMRANFDRLIEGASGAAKASLRQSSAQLALLVSCVGRKLILKQRVEEELEAVRDVLGPTPTIAGFYSYGELAPFRAGEPCQLHNQTMTITTLSEV